MYTYINSFFSFIIVIFQNLFCLKIILINNKVKNYLLKISFNYLFNY